MNKTNVYNAYDEQQNQTQPANSQFLEATIGGVIVH
jgi:hypothetical protein